MVGEQFRQRRGAKHKARRRLALCGTLRDDSPVNRRVRTANYSQDARWRLADAIVEARKAAGHPHRPSFYKAAGIGKRSLEAAESKEPDAPSVGETVLHAIGHALPNWTTDTPRIILEGGPIPANQRTRATPSSPLAEIIAASEDELDKMERLYERYRPGEGRTWRAWADGVRAAHSDERDSLTDRSTERDVV
jgi:hypothetical protein